MTRQQYLLIKLMEEATELANQASKALIFGVEEQRDLSTTNHQRMDNEFNDVLGIVQMLSDEGVYLLANQRKIDTKIAKVEEFMEYSRELGILEHE